MKKKSIIHSLAIVATIVALQACSQNDKAAQKEKSEEPKKEIAHADYQCPMDCENRKIYHESGNCPVCKMDLVKIERNENEKHEHRANADDTVPVEKHKHKDGDGHKH